MSAQTKFSVILFIVMTFGAIFLGILGRTFLDMSVGRAVVGALLLHWFSTGALSLFGLVDWSEKDLLPHEKLTTKGRLAFYFFGTLLGWFTTVCLIAIAIVNDPEECEGA